MTPGSTRASYDTIGVNYSDLRKPDARIQARIDAALGSAGTVLNVGAGTGSYEPAGKRVTAIEPSEKMIRQRRASAAPAVRGCAEDLPFDDKSFDASMAVLTIHHWADQARGLAEMRRVTRGRIVLLTFDPEHRDFWLLDYFPAFIDLDDNRMPAMSRYEQSLGPVEISAVPIPHDCTDGFLAAYWRRPEAYLDPGIRAAISCFWMVDNVSEGLNRLANDLDSGAWAERYSDLLKRDEVDFGYRLVTTK